MSGINPEAIIDNVEVDYSSLLGRGSDATVFTGVWHTPVAVKVLHPILVERGNDGRESLLSRFGSECNRLRDLRHERVVQFLGVARSRDGTPALVTEKMSTTLQKLYETSRLSTIDVLDIFSDAASGLAYLHSQGVVHRDLTTRNVLLTAAPHRRAKVADVGVSRTLHGNSRLSNVAESMMTQCPGTLSYMPPEALCAEPRYDAALDSFSFGVLMMATVVGREPSDSVLFSPREVLKEDGSKRVIPELERRTNDFNAIARDHPLRDVIRQCLENDPKNRPSAREIYRKLFVIRQRLRREMLRQQPGMVGQIRK